MKGNLETTNMKEMECFFTQISVISKDYFATIRKLRVLRYIQMAMNMKVIIWRINGMAMGCYKIVGKNINMTV